MATNKSPAKPLWRKWLKRLGIFLLLLFFVLFLTFFFLPHIISSTWFENQVQSLGKSYFKQELKVRDIHWRWSKGLTISGLSLSDHPDFSDQEILKIDNLHLSIRIAKLFTQKQPGLKIELQGAELSLIRNQEGQLNLNRLLPPETTAKKTAAPRQKDWQKMSFALPLDLRAEVSLNKINLSMQDKAGKQSLALHNASLHLDMPSLQNSPVNIRLRALPSLNQERLAPVQLAISLQELVTKQNLQPALARFSLNATLPGLMADLQGSLASHGLHSHVQIDLDRLSRTLTPFIAQPLPKAKGNIDIRTRIRTSAPDLQDLQGNINIRTKDLSFSAPAGLKAQSRNLSLALDFKAQIPDKVSYQADFSLPELNISGPGLKDKAAGPLALNFSQKGSLDLQSQSLDITRGKLELQDKSRLYWQGTVSGLQTKDPGADIRLGPLYLDLGELLNLARPFLPSSLPELQFAAAEDSLFALEVEQIEFKASSPAKQQTLKVQDLALTVPGLQAQVQQNELKLQDMSLRLPSMQVLTASSFPQKIQLRAGLSLESLSWSGPGDVRIKQLQMPDITCSVTDIKPTTEGPFKLKGRLQLKQSLRLKEINSSFLQALGISQDADLSLALQPEARARISLNSLNLDLSKLRIKSDMGDVSLPELQISSSLSTKADYDFKTKEAECRNLTAKITIQDLLKAKLQAAFQESGKKDLDIKSSGSLNLSNILPLLDIYLPLPLALTGRANWELALQGRLPTDEQRTRLLSPEITLTEKLKEADFLSSMYLLLKPQDLMLDYNPEQGPQMKIKEIKTLKPLQINLKKGLKDITSSLLLQLQKIESPQLTSILNRPLSPKLSYEMSLEDLNLLQLNTQLQLPELGVSQNMELTWDNLSKLLDSKNPAADILTKTEAKGKADLQTILPAQHISGLKGSGRLTTGLKFQLKAQDNLNAGLFLNSPGLDLNLDQIMSLSGLKADLGLEKNYQIQTRHQETAAPRPSLSQEVLNPQSRRPSGPDLNIAEQNIPDSFTSPAITNPDLQLAKASVQSGPLNVQLGPLALKLDPQNPLPCIRKFSCDLLNGSILGSFCLLPGAEQNSIYMSCSFSGLQASQLLPQMLRQISAAAETEMSGRFSAELPLVSRPEDILQDLQLSAHLTHIGSRTLQQLLFALDPYENNENIVRQRKLLSHGSPRWIKLTIRNGNLSLSGEVQVKGITIQLPGVQRVQIANLGLKQRLKPLSRPLQQLQRFVQVLRAEKISIDSQGRIVLQ